MNKAKTIKKLTRKKREYMVHHQEILGVAERVFTQKGYHGTTVGQIAREAEFAIGTIYKFFDSKEDLYRQVIQKIAQDFIDAFEKEVLSRDDPREAIAVLIELRLSHFQKHRGFFRIFFETTPGSRINPELAIPKNCIKMYDGYVRKVTGIFKRGVEIGVFAKLDPLYMTLCLQGVVNAFVAYWSRRGLDEPRGIDIGRLKDNFLSQVELKPSAGRENVSNKRRTVEVNGQR